MGHFPHHFLSNYSSFQLHTQLIPQQHRLIWYQNGSIFFFMLNYWFFYYVYHLKKYFYCYISTGKFTAYIYKYRMTFQALKEYQNASQHISDLLFSQWRSYKGGRGAITPSGSILALKKYTFSCVAINAKRFFWMENLRIQNSCPPPEGFAPPGNFPSYATASDHCFAIAVTWKLLALN